MALHPRKVFDAFAAHLSHFTAASDADVEDQSFDRKEAARETNVNVAAAAMREFKEQIKETVSAFANSNADGGLLVIGISKTGEIRGLNHLTDLQRTDISNIRQLLRHTGATVHWHE